MPTNSSEPPQVTPEILRDYVMQRVRWPLCVLACLGAILMAYVSVALLLQSETTRDVFDVVIGLIFATSLLLSATGLYFKSEKLENIGFAIGIVAVIAYKVVHHYTDADSALGPKV